jgi:hypothetical protein
MADYLQTLSPDALIHRYGYFTDHPELRSANLYNDQDIANQFAYDLARKTLNRAPTVAEIVGGPGVITASNVAQILADEKATVTAPPANQTADNMDSAATGIAAPATSTPGGTATSYGSQYSFGQAASTFAAPPSDNSSLLLMGLGAAVILYFTVFKHG